MTGALISDVIKCGHGGMESGENLRVETRDPYSHFSVCLIDVIECKEKSLSYYSLCAADCRQTVINIFY